MLFQCPNDMGDTMMTESLEYIDEVGPLPSQEQRDILNKCLQNINFVFLPPLGVEFENPVMKEND
jgi:hypothetical protein